MLIDGHDGIIRYPLFQKPRPPRKEMSAKVNKRTNTFAVTGSLRRLAYERRRWRELSVPTTSISFKNHYADKTDFAFYTVMCLSIGTPKTMNFPFVPNVKLIIFRCPKIWAHYNLLKYWDTYKSLIFHLGQMEK